MRIVTLNTWKNEGQYARRLDLMAEGLGELAPDVVCLQEAFQADGFDTARHLAEALGLKVTAAPARRKLRLHKGRRIESASGLAILSRQPPLGSGRLNLTSDAADGERIAQWADIAPDLRVLNLHLTHLRGPEASSLRRIQLEQAWQAATPVGAGLVVAGDFNATVHAPELASIADRLDHDGPATLQGERADRRPVSPVAIDHLALIQAGRWRISSRFRALDRPDAEGWFPSDHAAIAADLVRL